MEISNRLERKLLLEKLFAHKTHESPGPESGTWGAQNCFFSMRSLTGKSYRLKLTYLRPA
jgi:hypothetical protein